jgi:hypothetical protein
MWPTSGTRLDTLIALTRETNSLLRELIAIASNGRASTPATPLTGSAPKPIRPKTSADVMRVSRQTLAEQQAGQRAAASAYWRREDPSPAPPEPASPSPDPAAS